ncbi:DegV family protein [Alkalibacter mobilis]|uniref:DegV family protein n=1 Tax=Alkalibacter mobilis TaxID=2787712 RepID=UPI00189FE35F|nr:DegV family protein [Alkalibacter mobilis]MBF7096499.1 DegV family protein [Alkalibacter mobilis]
MTVKFITDSACDLSRDILEKENVDVIPIYVSIDGKDFKDGLDITSQEIYDGMRQGKVYKTAQITVHDFEEVFKKYALEGQDVIHMSFSSGLSGTYNAAVLASNNIKENYPNANIEVIDTKAAVNGLGLIVKDAIEARNSGAGYNDLIELIKERSSKIEHIFTVADLDYLFRGGRLSKGAAIVGNMLNIQPVLKVDHEGKLQQIEKVRGRKKLFNKILEIMDENADDLDKQTVALSHCDDIEEAEKLMEMIKERFGTENFIINMMGSAIGAHTGPGTICVFFYNSKNQS